MTYPGQGVAVAGEDKLLGDYYSLYFYSTIPSTTTTTTLTTAGGWRGDI